MQHSDQMSQNIQNWKNIRNVTVVRPTEVCGKVLSQKYGYIYKAFKTSLFLANVIDVDHQNSCLFTNKGHFLSPLWDLIGVLARFNE